MKAHHLRCLRFVAGHPGRRVPAFLGYRYYFDAPELKRAPFKYSTLESLIESGHLGVRVRGYSRDDLVEITAKGQKALEPKP